MSSAGPPGPTRARARPSSRWAVAAVALAAVLVAGLVVVDARTTDGALDEVPTAAQPTRSPSTTSRPDADEDEPGTKGRSGARARPVPSPTDTPGPAAPSTGSADPGDATQRGGSGAAVDGPWALAHSDDFTALDREVWGVYDGPGNGDTGPRDAANTFVQDGALHLRTARVGGEWHGAGVSSARGGWTQTYGRYEARVRFEAGYGVRAVALLWPTEGWPPEVDFFEIPATVSDRSVSTMTNHYRVDGRKDQELAEVRSDFTQWHVVGVEWSPGLLVYTLDGREVARMTEHVPHQPMWLGLQTAQGRIADGIVPAANAEAVDFVVDWVRVYEYTGPR